MSVYVSICLSHTELKMIIKVCVWSVLLYASETRRLTEDDIKILEVMEMCIMYMEENGKKISRTDHVTNEVT